LTAINVIHSYFIVVIYIEKDRFIIGTAKLAYDVKWGLKG